MANFSGTWKLKEAQNFEELLEKVGITPELKAKLSSSDAVPTVEIKQDGDNFTIKTITKLKTRENSFKVGETFVDQDIKEIKGIDVTVKSAWEGGKLVLTNAKEATGTKAERELVNGEMHVTFTYQGVVAKRIFTKA
ncbi:cellular retinoic acid-binding protein 1-like [Anneissia japonica]|uniref:cellular retinoic acid-binding protein 1-like n=1 Tax=Anneissia japonica TaxID=1529436 RepID=UPI001425AA9B|nr:cellular retinoic acid-binding protein 1-like [Anneissia japonica]